MNVILALMVIHSLIGSGSAICKLLQEHTPWVKEGDSATLTCHAEDEGADQVSWKTPGGVVVSTNCTSSDDKYAIRCSKGNGTNVYKLVFMAEWKDRGEYECSCGAVSKVTTRLRVKVPVNSLVLSCTLQETGEPCDDIPILSTDTLVLKADVGCSYPSPTVNWKSDSVGPIDNKKFGVKFIENNCTADGKVGQTSVTSSFRATYGDLSKPLTLRVVAVNEVGQQTRSIVIQDEPDAPADTTAIVIGAVVAVVLVLILVGLIGFLCWRAKKRRRRNEYV